MEALLSRGVRNRKNSKHSKHAKKDTTKITITAKITKTVNQGRDTDKYIESLKESSEMITNQVFNSCKYNKSLKESRERGFTVATKITITAKITKITNLGSDTGKHNKSLKESREFESGFTNGIKISMTTLILDFSSF